MREAATEKNRYEFRNSWSHEFGGKLSEKKDMNFAIVGHVNLELGCHGQK